MCVWCKKKTTYRLSKVEAEGRVFYCLVCKACRCRIRSNIMLFCDSYASSVDDLFMDERNENYVYNEEDIRYILREMR